VVSRSMAGVCCSALCLVAACIVVDLATLVARVTQSPWGHTVVVYLGGTRGEGPKPGSLLGDDPPWGLS